MELEIIINNYIIFYEYYCNKLKLSILDIDWLAFFSDLYFNYRSAYDEQLESAKIIHVS